MEKIQLVSITLQNDTQLHRFREGKFPLCFYITHSELVDGRRKFEALFPVNCSAIGVFLPPKTYAASLQQELGSSFTIHKGGKASINVSKQNRVTSSLTVTQISLFIEIGSQEPKKTTRNITKEYQALSWLNVSPSFPERNSHLPFHIAVLSRSTSLLSCVPTHPVK